MIWVHFNFESPLCEGYKVKAIAFTRLTVMFVEVHDICLLFQSILIAVVLTRHPHRL